MRRTCTECEARRVAHCRPATRHVDWTIDYVCPRCWRALGYEEFMDKEGDGADAP